MLSQVAILQRVASASVSVDNHLISSIGKGVLVFAAVAVEDTRKEVESMAAKVLKMKLWPDEIGATVCRQGSLHARLATYLYVSRNGKVVCKRSRERFSAVGSMDGTYGGQHG